MAMTTYFINREGQLVAASRKEYIAHLKEVDEQDRQKQQEERE